MSLIPQAANIHRKILPLLTPSTRANRRQNSILYGGRGGLKTYGAADCAIIRASQQYERILCARETMDSIAESVHFTLEKRIYELGLQKFFKIMQYKIEGPEFPGYGHSEFFFAGLRHNVRNIKSLEAVTICWVEEAANVSKESWDTLLPTIRWEDKNGSGREAEIWVTFNPELESDDTYQRWVLNPPPYTYAAKTSYLDNPWLPEGLRIQMEHAQRTDPAAYQHVWLGECRSAVTGAIYGSEMQKALDEGRVGNFPVDRMRPVDTFWDLGYGDKTAIWFAQAMDGWYNIVDYFEDSGRIISEYVIELQKRGYLYGNDWLPHDCVDAIIHKRLGGSSDRSIEQILRAAGRNIRITPKLPVNDGINAARTIFPQCRFNKATCQRGIDCLSSYQWAPPTVKKLPTGATALVASNTPLHDWASHGADAFRGLALSIKQPRKEPVKQHKPPAKILSAWS